MQMLDVPEAEETENEPMLKLIINQLSRIEKEKTARQRQIALEITIAALSSMYGLAFPGKNRAAAADYVVNALIYLMIKADITQPFSN